MKPYMQRPGHERRIYPVLQGVASEATMQSIKEMSKSVRAVAIELGGRVLIPIHDEVTIVMPDAAGCRRMLAQLASLMRPSMPRSTIVDPIASYLVRHYGIPGQRS